MSKKQEELECLHNYVVDDLSIEYHSSKKLYEGVMKILLEGKGRGSMIGMDSDIE